MKMTLCGSLILNPKPLDLLSHLFLFAPYFVAFQTSRTQNYFYYNLSKSYGYCSLAYDVTAAMLVYISRDHKGQRTHLQMLVSGYLNFICSIYSNGSLFSRTVARASGKR
jgi:hypothetical protein